MHEPSPVCARPAGRSYLTIPFMQPEHLDPTDFQALHDRRDWRLLCERHGFRVDESLYAPATRYLQ